MNFLLSEDQRALVAAIERLCQDFPLHYWREQDDKAQFPHAFHQARKRFDVEPGCTPGADTLGPQPGCTALSARSITSNILKGPVGLTACGTLAGISKVSPSASL